MWQDLRFGLRTLSKNPGFTAVAMTALALGIGANATVFSLVNAILFKNLPFADSERVLYITSFNASKARSSNAISWLDYQDLRSELKSFTGLGASTREFVNLSDDASVPDGYPSARVTANSFTVLGQRPILGRDFVAGDEKPGAEPVAILAYALWEKRYGKDPSILGKKIRVDAVPTTVIGVMARGFALPADANLWTQFIPTGKESRKDRELTVFGKLASGVSQSVAQSEVATVAQRLEASYRDTNKDVRLLVQNFNEFALRGPVRTIFLVLMGAVGFVLLIACANVANLLLSRAVGRAREISIRAALGAGRWRVVRQLLIESLLLSIGGGLAGWALASWGIRAFDAAVVPTGKPVWIDFTMDYRVLAYLAAIVITTALLFGMAPAMRLSRLDINSALKDGARGASSGLRGKYLSGLLVVVEMMLAVVLLIGAVLLMRSFLVVYQRSPGVNTANILTMRVELPNVKYGKAAEQLEFQRQLIQRLRALPAVENATIASTIIGTGGISLPYEVEGQAVDAEQRPSVSLVVAADGYFETLRLSALRGRVLNSADYSAGPATAVLNDAMARQLWPGQDPVGKRFRTFKNGAPGDWITVVGMIPNVLQNTQRSQPEPAAIIPSRLEPKPWMSVMARTRVNASTLGNAFRHEVQLIDRDLPVRDVMTLDDQFALSRWPMRVFGAMFGIFAGIALMLATVGLYAVVAYAVSQRTQEIGVRMALGASTSGILRLIVGSGMRQVAIGLALGLTAALGVTKVLSALLVGVSATDPLTFVIVATLLIVSAALGCLIPARRAMRVDPVIALRHE